MGYFSDAYNSIASIFGGGGSNDTAGGDAAAGMYGEESKKEALAAGFKENEQHENSALKSMADSFQKDQKEKQAQEEREFQQFANSGGGAGNFLPRIQSGEIQKEDPMLQSQVKPAQVAGGPFTGVLNNIRPQFIS